MNHSALLHALVLTVLIGCGSLAAVEEARPHQDYQRVAEGARWEFHEDEADPLSNSRSADAYGVRMTSSPAEHSSVRIEILAGERVAYAWDGHVRSVFRILGDRLYYARFHPSNDGGLIVAVDLKTGKELWSSPLIGLGGVEHSAYRTRLLVDANEDAVTIHGLESFGNYLEFKDASSGVTIGHRVFERGYGERRKPVPMLPTVTDADSRITVACVSATVLAATDPAGKELWRVDMQNLARADQRPLLHIQELSTNMGRVFVSALSTNGASIGPARGQTTVIQLMLDSGMVKLGDK